MVLELINGIYSITVGISLAGFWIVFYLKKQLDSFIEDSFERLFQSRLTTITVNALSSRGHVEDEPGDGAGADACGAFGEVSILLVHERCAGDVEVSPGSVIGEELEEQRAGCRPGGPVAYILDVGDITLQLLPVFIIHG